MKHINEGDFKSIKSMLSVGVKDGQICKLTGRSYLVINRINKAKTLEEYQEVSKRLNAEGRMKRLSVKKVVHADAETPSTPIYDILVEIRDELRTSNAYIKAMGRT